MELRRILRATQIEAKRLARETGLTTSQLVVLGLLQADRELTPRQIALSMNLTQATVTSLLDRLQDRGLISRQRGELDRRQVLVRLTPRGEQQLATAPPSLQERFVREFGRLETWEKTAILAALQRVAHLMDVASFDAAPVLDTGPISQRDEP